jgi:hypothetical protein
VHSNVADTRDLRLGLIDFRAQCPTRPNRVFGTTRRAKGDADEPNGLHSASARYEIENIAFVNANSIDEQTIENFSRWRYGYDHKWPDEPMSCETNEFVYHTKVSQIVGVPKNDRRSS